MKYFTALARGFYGGALIEEGDVFLAPDDFNSKWAVADGEKPSDAAKAKLKEEKGLYGDLLAKKVEEIAGELHTLSDKDLQGVLDAECSSTAPRKSLVAKLQDEIDNRRLAAGDPPKGDPLLS